MIICEIYNSYNNDSSSSRMIVCIKLINGGYLSNQKIETANDFTSISEMIVLSGW